MIPRTQPTKSKLRHPKPLFVGAKAFMRAAKHSNPFAIYATSAREEASIVMTIPDQYKEFQDVF